MRLLGGLFGWMGQAVSLWADDEHPDRPRDRD
jgi:hypothetical protein